MATCVTEQEPEKAEPKSKWMRPMRSIRKHCLDCQGDSSMAVQFCTCDGVHSTRCHLWFYRFGKRPGSVRDQHFVNPAAMPDANAPLEGLSTVDPTDAPKPDRATWLRPLLAVRKNCLQCSGGRYLQVKWCPAAGLHTPFCHLWPYRFGKRPESVRDRKRLDPAAMPDADTYLEMLP